MAAFFGRKFRVSTTRSGGDEFEGILHSLDTFNKKISLMKVCIVSSGKRLPGLHHFYGQEIVNLVEVTDEEDNKAGKSSQASKKAQEDESDTEEDILNTNTSDGYIYVHRIGSKFRQAVAHIKTQQLMSVAVESETLGRSAKVSLLEVCCLPHVFIFDVLSLGSAVFSEGLADILESPTVVKVMHDSRWVSDQLFHQYSLKITNVYDTQAADVLVRMRRLNGELPQKLRSLGECLMEYLDLRLEEVYTHWYHDKSGESESSSLWLERPLQPSLLLQAAGRVRHLSDLRIMMLHHLLAEFTASVDVFLSCLRDMSDMSRSKAKVGPSLVPRQLEKLVFGPLPSTSYPPVSSHSTSAIGYNPLHTGPSPQPESKKVEPSPMERLSPSDTSTPKPHTSDSSPGTFITPRVPVTKVEEVRYGTGSSHSPRRLTNGFEPPSIDRSHKEPTHSTPAAAENSRTSPRADERSVKRKGQDNAGVTMDEGIPATTEEETGGYWDGPDGGHVAASEGVDVLASSPSASKGTALRQDPVTDYERASEKQKSQMANGNKKGDCVEDDDDDDDDSDDDGDQEDYDNDIGQSKDKKEDSKPTKDRLHVSSEQSEPHEHSLRQSSDHPHLSLAQNTTSQRGSTRASGRTLANNYPTSPGTVSNTYNTTREHSHGRLYSSALTAAGLVRGRQHVQQASRQGLNVLSPSEFPELGHEVQEKPPKRHAIRGRDNQVSNLTSSSNRNLPGTEMNSGVSGEGTVTEGGRNTSRPRQQGAVPKMASSHTRHSEDTGYQSPSTAWDSGDRQSPQQRTSPAVGRGRARMLACHEDILRSIHRPMDLERINGRVQRFDFPSKEEMDKVPKPKPLRASFYYTDPKDTDSG